MICQKCHRTVDELTSGLCPGCFRVVSAQRETNPIMLRNYMMATNASSPIGLKEAAKFLGCSVSGLRKICRRQAIRFRQSRPHAPIYFERDWLEEYKEQETIKPSATTARAGHQPALNENDGNTALCSP